MTEMCWEFEDKYDECFDWIWENFTKSEYDIKNGIKDLLEEAVLFTNKGYDYRNDFYDLLSKWHKEGLIKPKDKEKLSREEVMNKLRMLRSKTNELKEKYKITEVEIEGI